MGSQLNKYGCPYTLHTELHYILNGFGLVGTGAGAIFCLRNDLSMKSFLIAKDVYLYAQEGIEIKIKNGWFEEPPQMEDRARIINNGN